MAQLKDSILVGTKPKDWGLPDSFKDWRSGQIQCIEDIIDCPTPISGHCAPTGMGKSLALVAAAKISNSRLCVLTSTLGLQKQYLDSFQDHGLVDIRGKNNYDCNDRVGLTCEEAWPICKAKGSPGECPYKAAKTAAARAPMVVTNYSCWLNQSRNGAAFTKAEPDDEPLPFDILGLDESHEAPDELAKFVAVELTTEDMAKYLKAQIPSQTLPMTEWKSYAATFLPRIKSEVQDIDSAIRVGMKLDDAHLRDHIRLTRVRDKLQTLATCNPDLWVVEPTKHGFGFEPVWPGNYTKLLFQNVPRIVLMSATIRPKTMHLLGLKDDAFTFNEYPSSFSPADCPIIHVPTVKMRYDISPDDLRMLYSRIDQIIRLRLDRKGIIHSVSYRRALDIVQASEHKQYMLANTRVGMGLPTADTVSRFKSSRAPSILVSPSVATGYDFPGVHCEYNIVPKLPFVDARSAVMKERRKRDPEYDRYITAQDLTQMCGRGNRFEGDRCQNFILDDSIFWFARQNRHLFPKYFWNFYKQSGTIPPPLLKMV